MSFRQAGRPWMSLWYSSAGMAASSASTRAAADVGTGGRAPGGAEAQLDGAFGGGGDGEDQGAVGVEPSNQQHPGPSQVAERQPAERHPGGKGRRREVDAAQEFAGRQAVPARPP